MRFRARRRSIRADELWVIVKLVQELPDMHFVSREVIGGFCQNSRQLITMNAVLINSSVLLGFCTPPPPSWRASSCCCCNHSYLSGHCSCFENRGDNLLYFSHDQLTNTTTKYDSTWSSFIQHARDRFRIEREKQRFHVVLKSIQMGN